MLPRQPLTTIDLFGVNGGSEAGAYAPRSSSVSR